VGLKLSIPNFFVRARAAALTELKSTVPKTDVDELLGRLGDLWRYATRLTSQQQGKKEG